MGRGFEDDVTKFLALAAFGVLAAACGNDDLTKPVEAGLKAALTADPLTGTAPLTVKFDAKGSTDPLHPGSVLIGRFDFDSNGSADAPDTTELVAEHTYTEGGTFTAKVVVQGVEGRADSAELVIEVTPNTPPVAALSPSPSVGRAPLTVTLDASASSDVDQDAATLEVRFDFEGDGTFDTEFSAGKTASHQYLNAGTVSPAVEVKDRGGLTTIFRAEGGITLLPGADLDVDTNRNGAIDDTDELDEETWAPEHGAVFMANVDDDDANGRADALDNVISGQDDSYDLTPITVRRHGDLVAGRDTARLSITPATANRFVRIFAVNGAGALAPILDPQVATANLDVAAIAAGDVALYLEGVTGRSSSWDGKITLTLTVTFEGEEQVDAVALRAAPVVFTDNLRPAEALFVMRISDNRLGENLAFSDALRDGIPAGVELIEADQYDYGADRWIQDNMQAGYQAIVGEGGANRVMPTFLQLQRPTGNEGLEHFLEDGFLAPDRGFMYPGRSRDTSLNYGGNFEVAPPHVTATTDYPLGRLIVGGGDLGSLRGVPYEDHWGENQRAFVEAQEVQGPAIEVSSEWLAVGHIDEIFQIVPKVTTAPGERPWAVVLASPALGRRLLNELSAAGGGARAVFSGRQPQTTVARILGNAPIMSLNDAAQARIDTVREGLKTNLGLADSDFIEVPVLFENDVFQGLDLAFAYNPGIQNLVTTNTTLFVPDPEGPVGDDGIDVWEKSAGDALRALGNTPIFVDVFESYHLNLGEAHCGTNVLATAYTAPWWSARVGRGSR